MANELTPKWRSLFPLAIVLASLFSLAVSPLLVQWRIGERRAEIIELADPAEELVSEIRLSLALELASTRAFLLTGDPRHAAARSEARLRRMRAYAALLRLTRRLDPRVHADATAFGRDLTPFDARLDALYGGRLSREQYMAQMETQQAGFQHMVDEAAILNREIRREVAARRAEIEETVGAGSVLSVVLVLVAIAGAILVAQLGRHYRALAQRLDVRAREQETLREIARELSETVSFREAVQTAAERTVDTTRATGVYVESVDVPEPAGTVEVLAAAGTGGPPVGTRVAYTGSLTEAITISGKPEILTEAGAIGEKVARYLVDSCRRCSGLIVPLSFEDGGRGALVLLRGPAETAFNEDDAAYARVLGDIASAAFRRVMLLERERAARREVSRILESITDAFITMDAEWRLTYVNHEAERLIEKPRSELLGRSLWGEFPELIDSTFYRKYHDAMASQETAEFEEYYAPREMWVDVRAYPSPKGLSVYFVDVTARKRNEQRLRESERNFRALGNSIPQLAWMADPGGSVFWYNDRWYEYTGTTFEQMKAAEWRTVLHPRHADRVVERFRQAIATGKPWEDTFPLRSRTGEYRWFLSRAMPILDSQGNVVRWFGTNTDVTQRIEASAERERLLESEHQARTEAERRKAELEQVTESRARLVRGFSHDVKNPLGAADGYLQLLEAGVLDHLTDPQKQGVERARASVRAALGLIDDLLELERADTGRMQIERARTDVREVVRNAAEEYRAQAEAGDLTLTLEFSEALPVIDSDKRRIRQVVGNLLSNAVKYTQRGSISVRGSVRSGGKAPGPGRWIAIDVADTGAGISEEEQDLIFREFRRLERAGGEKGTGIGLAISQRVARALGGTITVESVAGRGSTFTLWLPVPA